MDGILLADKPVGPTSFQVVRQVKARIGSARVGHLGTLDPFASGLLPLLIGQATRLAPFLHQSEKEYEGLIRLGIETDTLDLTGKVVGTAEVPNLKPDSLNQVARQFTGKLRQVPPLFSAIKRGGTPLYKLARRGVSVEPPPPREVEISALSLWPEGRSSIRFKLTCSTGTYVRSLARDIGVSLGTVAHLAELRRLKAGNFSVEESWELGELLQSLESGSLDAVVSLRLALPALAELDVDASTARRVRHGDARALDGLVPPCGQLLKIVSGENLVALAKPLSGGGAALVRCFGE